MKRDALGHRFRHRPTLKSLDYLTDYEVEHSLTLKPKGKLIIIGGAEDKAGRMQILRESAAHASAGKLVVMTLASHTAADDLWQEYREVFGQLGVKSIEHLDMGSREEAVNSRKFERTLEGAAVVFLTGGDQLKLTSQLGGTSVSRKLRELYFRGATVCGTSAGASAMSETMLVAGEGKESHRIGSSLRMAPGLGFVKGMIIDQHFAERGRIGRLLGALAQNPESLGVGIDENTAIVVEHQLHFRVIGGGAVYVLDGHDVTGTNISDQSADQAMSIHNVKLHVLCDGDQYDLRTRRPLKTEPARALSRRETKPPVPRPFARNARGPVKRPRKLSAE